MRITWVTIPSIGQTPGGQLTSPLASIRLRILAPIAALNRPPFQHQILTASATDLKPESFELMKADVVIFNKCMHRPLHEAARKAGAKIVFDICDNHFDEPAYEAECRWIVNNVDLVTCNSPWMKEVVETYTRVPCAVIADPYEGPRGIPKFEPGLYFTNVLWFGTRDNIGFLQEFIRTYHKKGMHSPINLTLMTTVDDQLTQECALYTQRHRTHVNIFPVAWTLESQEHALRSADMIIIPSADTPRTRTKSANRVIQALWAGRFVAAYPLPAYEEFRPWTWLGEEINEGIRWAKDHAEKIPGMIEGAQRHIAEHYSAAAIGRQWEQAFRGALEKAA